MDTSSLPSSILLDRIEIHLMLFLSAFTWVGSARNPVYGKCWSIEHVTVANKIDHFILNLPWRHHWSQKTECLRGDSLREIHCDLFWKLCESSRKRSERGITWLWQNQSECFSQTWRYFKTHFSLFTSLIWPSVIRPVWFITTVHTCNCVLTRYLWFVRVFPLKNDREPQLDYQESKFPKLLRQTT